MHAPQPKTDTTATLMLVALGPSEASPLLALASGFFVGLIVASASRVLRVWPGGFWSAAAAHFLVVYLIAGYAG